MANKRISQLDPCLNPTLSGVIPIVNNGVTEKISLNQLVNFFGSNIDVTITGGTFSAGTAVYTNSTGGTFSITGFTIDSNYVPYIGATQAVDLSGNSFTAGMIFIGDNLGSYLGQYSIGDESGLYSRVNDGEIATYNSSTNIYNYANGIINYDVTTETININGLFHQTKGVNDGIENYSDLNITDYGLNYVSTSGSDFDNFGNTQLLVNPENGIVAKYFNPDGSIYNIEESLNGNIQKTTHSTLTNDVKILNTVEGVSGTTTVEQTPTGFTITTTSMTLNGNEVATVKSKIYKAIIEQSGTAAPIVTVLENTIGDIVWTRVNSGYYQATLAGAFTLNKTFIHSPSLCKTHNALTKIWFETDGPENHGGTPDKLYLFTAIDTTFFDGLLSDGDDGVTMIYIEVYP